MAKTSTLYDTFATLDTGLWTPVGGSVSVSGEQLVLPALATYQQIKSVASYDLTNSFIRMKWAQRPNVSNDSTELNLRFEIDAANGGGIAQIMLTSTLFAMRESGSGDTSVAFDAAHLWMGLRHDGTNLIFETSPDGTTWTTRRTIATTHNYTLGKVVVEAGNWNAAPTPGTALVDQVNPAAAGNQAPTASAGPDQSVLPWSTVTLNSVASSDPDGTIASRVWTHISGPTNVSALSSATAASPTYPAPVTIAGATDVWRVTVTDNTGATSSDDVSVTAAAVNERAVIGGAEVPMRIFAVSLDPNVGVQAIAANQLADNFGVQVHMGFYDTAYNDTTLVASKAQELGVKWLRDSFNTGWTTQHQRQVALAQTLGAKYVMGARYSDPIADFVSGVAAEVASVTAMIEGINEPDNGGGEWAANTRTHQQALFAAVRANATLAAKPILAPAVANYLNAATLGDLSAYCDYGNAHVYPNGTEPMPALTTIRDAVKAVSGSSKPVITTETGYHDAFNDADTSMKVVSEAVAGVYAPRLLAEHLLAGSPRTFFYELLDQRADAGGTDIQQHYGLVRNNGTSKPAFTALKNLLALAADTGASTPGKLDYTVSTTATDIQQLLLQRSDGSFLLLLWRRATIWNPNTRTDVTVAPVTATVGLPTTKAVTVYRPSTQTAATTATTNASSVAVSLDGQLTVVKVA